MPDDPAPDNTPTPPHNPPSQPRYPQQPPQGGYGSDPWVGVGPTGSDPGLPSYLDTPAPVVSKADPDKPPVDFDG